MMTDYQLDTKEQSFLIKNMKMSFKEIAFESLQTFKCNFFKGHFHIS